MSNVPWDQKYYSNAKDYKVFSGDTRQIKRFYKAGKFLKNTAKLGWLKYTASLESEYLMATQVKFEGKFPNATIIGKIEVSYYIEFKERRIN